MSVTPRTRIGSLVSSCLVILAVGGGCKPKATSTWPATMRVETAEGTMARVGDARGDVVVYALYAAWCSGCRRELPLLDRLAARHASEGLRVLAFSLDEDPRDFAEMLEEHPVSSAFGFARVVPPDTPALARAVSGAGGTFSGSIPYVALFDRGGRLVAEWNDDRAAARELEARVAPLLSAPHALR